MSGTNPTYLHVLVDVPHEDVDLLFRPHALFPLMT